MPEQAIRVLLIEDHEIVREGLRLLFKRIPHIKIIGEAKDRKTSMDAIRHCPDIILLDLQLGTQHGLEILPDLIERCPTAKVIILTAGCSVKEYRHALALGARGIVLKEQSSHILLQAIKRVMVGELWIEAATMAAIASSGKYDQSGNVAFLLHRNDGELYEIEKIASLSTREREIISLIGEGLKNQEIADRLFITERTVRFHLNNIFDKLEVRSRAQLLIYAHRYGVLSRES